MLSTTDTLASTPGKDNPTRYRGYYYDIETGLYYLQSRYYDPDTGRFINSDDVAFFDATGTVLSHNLFVIRMLKDGKWKQIFEWVITKLN